MAHPRPIQIAKTIGQPRRPRERELEDIEIRAYWQAASELGFPYGDYFKVLLLTGQRRDEVAEMQRSELDLERGIYRLPASKFKGQREHVIPLSPTVVDILKACPVWKTHPKGYVFSTTFGRTHINSFGHMKSVALESRMLRIMRKETGDPALEMKQWGLHDARRTQRTRMAMLGIDWVTAELCIGHKLRGMHAVYDRFTYIPQRLKAYTLYAEHILDVVAGKSSLDLVQEAAE
jgi:integrase